VSAFPNPFYTTATIEFQNVSADPHVLIELFSTTKEKIGVLFDGEARRGQSYKVDFNAGGLPPGIYVYRITNGHQVVNKKILLKR
jgi:hypothetical protein